MEAGTVPIRAVFFDVGETPIDESTEYGAWADRSGVPRHTFSAVFARGGDYREVFQHLRPGFDLHTERQRRAEGGSRSTSTAVTCTRTPESAWPRSSGPVTSSGSPATGRRELTDYYYVTWTSTPT